MSFEQISDNIVENFIEEVTKIITEQGEAQALQVISNEFLVKISQFKDQIDNIQKQAEHMQNLRHSLGNGYKEATEYKKLLQERKKMMSDLQWQQFMTIIEKYTIQLNSILGQQIKTIYVSVSGRKNNKQVNIYDLSGQNDQFFKPGISKTNQLIGRLTPTLKQLKTQGLEITKFDLRQESEVETLKNTYLEALNRYINSKQRRIIYWQKNKNNYDAVWVSSKGDIAEAFLHSLFSNKPKLAKHIETNIGRFALIVLEVDTGSGILSGDFASQDGKIQYAAKSFGASMAGITQLIDLATQISKGEIYNIEQLKQVQKTKAQSAGLRNLLLKDIEEEKDELIDFIKQNLSKK